MSQEELLTLLLRLDERIGEVRDLLVAQRTVKDWYTTEEAAELLDRSSYTVREWCRQGRIRAEKRPCGRGTAAEWIIAHRELERFRNHGLLPPGTRSIS